MDLVLLVTFLVIAPGIALGDTETEKVSEYYTAAVFEHARLGDPTSDDPLQSIRRNLKMFERATKLASEKGADIIVFPEYGIFPPHSREYLKKCLEYTPDPQHEVTNPCEKSKEFSDRPILFALSCMAKRNSIVVVANTGDIQPCVQESDSNCPPDGVYHFNTNVAFDRNGTLISRYHKQFLFYELGMDLPQEPQYPVFTTDLGSFSMYICFDIVFANIVETAKHVDNVILSVMWVDNMPLMNAVQMWQSWALGNNVTLLVSNTQIPGYITAGSGVFSGHTGAIKYTYNPDGLSKLVVSRAPKSKHQSDTSFLNTDSSITVITENEIVGYDEEGDGKSVPEQCSYDFHGMFQNLSSDYRCLHQNTMNYTFVKLAEREGILETCNNGMCYSLNYSATSMDETFYLGVHNGTYNMVDRYFWCTESCLVIRCDPNGENPCGTFPTKSNTVFESFELSANFTTRYVYPSVVMNSMRLAPMSEWNFDIHDVDNHLVNGRIIYRSHLSKPLAVAGFNGRCYDRDPPYRR